MKIKTYKGKEKKIEIKPNAEKATAEKKVDGK